MLAFPKKPMLLFIKTPSSLRPFLLPLSSPFSTTQTHTQTSPFFLSSHPLPIEPYYNPQEIASSFKQWFLSRDPTIFDLIFKILSTSSSDADSVEFALSRLNLRLSESFVLQVLAHHRSRDTADVLPCLKFFDWAGRQPRFHHTRATYHAIFKILSKAKLMTVMLDWLNTYTKQRNLHRVRFYDTLVMGYAVAGKTDIALHLFAKMRFQGLDLDTFAYHVLLNALVEDDCFDVAEVILKQIAMRGIENEITSCIRMKYFCKQNRLEDAVGYLRDLECGGGVLNEHIVGVLVNALCKQKRFEEGRRLVEEFAQLGKGCMNAPTYSFWIIDLIDAGKVDEALDFFQMKKLEGYAPEVLCYSKLICGLLAKNRLGEVYDLLVEMREGQMVPDRLTMNAALCFFCKAGMVDVAVELYNSRLEVGLMPIGLTYNYLISALCGEGNIDEAFRVSEDALNQGYFPGRRAFHFLVDALCREKKLDKISKLLDVALQRKFKPSNAVYVKYISALCRAGKPEEGYLVSSGSVLNESAYIHLIREFSKLRKEGMATRLLLEMIESGYTPSRSLNRAVICCLCETGNTEMVLNLLDMDLSRVKNDSEISYRCIYNCFIYGAGHAKKPELAREIFEIMSLRGIQPNMETNILILQSYLKTRCFSEALKFFYYLANEHEPSNRLYNIMIVGLCKAGSSYHALEMWSEVREKGMIPSLHCYEELVHLLCTCQNYDMVVNVLKDFQKTGRRVSSFICNVLLLHTLKKPELNRAWVQSGDTDGEESSSSGSLMLGQLVGAFSGGIRMKEHLENLEEVIEQFFPVDIYTCNMLLRGLTMEGRMDYACDLFNRICKKGYKPNRWTYDIIVHGFCKHDRRKEAERWMEAMYRNEFYPTSYTMDIYNNMQIKGK